PAQYGDRFAAVLNVGTRAYDGASAARADVEMGSLATVDSTFGYHARVGTSGSLSVAGRFGQNSRGIDPPVPDYTHNASSDVAQFLRYSTPLHGDDTLNFDLIHSLQSFQIPPDTANGVPPSTDDDEYQDDLFTSLQYRHDINSHGSLSFGPSFKRSHIVDTNDLANDLAGASGPCTDFSDCSFFSVYANRVAQDVRFNADYDLRSLNHDLRAGMLYGLTAVDKRYVITLQPFSQLNPNGTFTVTDSSPNTAHQQEAYVQYTWRLDHAYQLDYGVRADAFEIGSDGFKSGFAQMSPRIKLTRIFSARAAVYAYFGRLFVPFSFENVSPATGASLYVAAHRPDRTFDLRPQRDSLYEAGAHAPFGRGDLGLRISHKVSTDYIDDTQVGSTNLHQDINFPQGRVDIQSLTYEDPLVQNGRLTLSLTHGLAVTSANCETQLLQNCAASGPAGGPWVQADHDQRWSANAGLLMNEIRGGWFAANIEYGSGLSTDPGNCANGSTVNCKVPPHLTLDAEKGFALGRKLNAAIVVKNVFDDRYALTMNNSLQGTHYAQPRYVGVRLSVSP
ncbi:MAG: TonB-dependent receptor, partial [Candidatus Eremiobacteraeota bacterium]|nr:TonB-dependent receptor [Candidatus Eremiobacteraeota bacterium]